MNTTILFRPRRTGKTAELIRLFKDLHSSDVVLLLAPNEMMLRQLLKSYPELKSYTNLKLASYQQKSIHNALKGYRPSILFIDNGEWLELNAMEELHKVMKYIEHIYISGSDPALLKFKVPNLIFDTEFNVRGG